MRAWATVFKAVLLPPDTIQQRTAVVNSKERAEQLANDLNAGRSLPSDWSWTAPGRRSGWLAGRLWGVIEDLEPETNEYGDISP